MQEVRRYYGVPLKVYFPDGKLVEEYVASNGTNGFYDSVESRNACCFARKVAHRTGVQPLVSASLQAGWERTSDIAGQASEKHEASV